MNFSPFQIKTGIGQDSHPFTDKPKNLILGGILIPDCNGLKGNSDADVVLHAITNAISSISGEPILGATADEMCLQGITDSACYLEKALQTLPLSGQINHIAVSIEASHPRLASFIPSMKNKIAKICHISNNCVGITATSGEGLTACGKGEGITVTAIVSLVITEVS